VGGIIIQDTRETFRIITKLDRVKGIEGAVSTITVILAASVPGHAVRCRVIHPRIKGRNPGLAAT